MAGGYGPLCGFDAVYTDQTKQKAIPKKAERLQQNCRILTYAKGAGTKKALWEWINHLHRAFLMLINIFQRPQDMQPQTKESEPAGLVVTPRQAVRQNGTMRSGNPYEKKR